MIELLSYKFMQKVLLASVIGGASCGLVGVFVILMGIPFIGVAIAHSAFAGALIGLLIGFDPLITAIVFSIASAFIIGPMSEKLDLDSNISLGIIFSAVLGIAFLCMGFIKGSKAEALQFLWGNILTITGSDVLLMLILLIVILLFIILLYKEILATLFNKELALISGLPVNFVFYSILLLLGLVVSLNLNTIGGLLSFSLIINPAAAAYQLTYKLKNMMIYSALLSIFSSLSGLLCSYYFDAPSGSVIIIVSSIIFVIALLLSPKRKVKTV